MQRSFFVLLCAALLFSLAACNSSAKANDNAQNTPPASAQTPEAKTPEVKKPEAKTPEAKTPEAKTPEAKTPTKDPAPAKEPAKEDPKGKKATFFTIIDGSKSALLDSNGKQVQTFSYGAGKSSFTLFDKNANRVLIYDNFKVHALDLASGSGKVLATLPADASCKGKKVSMRTSWAFGLMTGAKEACIQLQDNNSDQMSVGIGYKVDLASGKSASAVVADYDKKCSKPANETFCEPDDKLFPNKTPRTSLDAGMVVERYECTVKTKDGKVVKIERPKGAEGWCDLRTEGFTKSGRFIAVSSLLSEKEGQQVKRVLDIVDLKAAKTLPKMRTTISGDTRLDWSTKADSMLVDGKLFLLSDSPSVVPVNAQTIYVER